MKKILLTLSVATMTVFTACTSFNDNPVSQNPSTAQTEYAILFYGCGGEDLDVHAARNMLTMFNCNPESYNKVKVACQYKYSPAEDLYANWLNDEKDSCPPELLKSFADMGQQTIRFVIDKNNEDAGNEVLFNPEYIYGPKSAHATNVDSLTNFINWATEACPAKHYILVLVDHGGGYYPYTDLTFEVPASSRKVVIADTEFNPDEYFTASSLKYAISRANARMDVIYMDACLMNTIEYQFELKDLTDYFVLSAAPSPAIGGSYNVLIDQLAKNGSDIEKTLKIFNKATISKWDTNFANLIAYGYTEIKCWYYDMTVTRTKDLDALGVKLREFTDKLIDAYANEEYKAKIDTITKYAFKTDGMTPRYDLARYTYNIIHTLPNVYGDDFELEFGTAFNNCVVSTYCSDFLMEKGLSINCTIMLGAEGKHYCYVADEDDPTKILLTCVFYPDGKAEMYTAGQNEPEVGKWKSTLADTYEKLEFDKVTGWSRWLKLNKQVPSIFSPVALRIPVE